MQAVNSFLASVKKVKAVVGTKLNSLKIMYIFNNDELKLVACLIHKKINIRFQILFISEFHFVFSLFWSCVKEVETASPTSPRPAGHCEQPGRKHIRMDGEKKEIMVKRDC